MTGIDLSSFDCIIDCRSPSEYAQDHIPGAVSAPVLDDAERASVGTLYKQVSPFEAKKLGAALVAKNVARHVETLFAGQGPRLAAAGVLLARRQALRRDGAHPARDRLGRADASRRLPRLPPVGRRPAAAASCTLRLRG